MTVCPEGCPPHSQRGARGTGPQPGAGTDVGARGRQSTGIRVRFRVPNGRQTVASWGGLETSPPIGREVELRARVPARRLPLAR